MPRPSTPPDASSGSGSGSGSSSGLTVQLEYPSRGFFLYPPAQQANVTSETDGLAGESHVVLGKVLVTAAQRTTIGPVRVAWETALTPKDGPRQVLARFEADAREDDSVIEKGTTVMPFTLSVPSVLPPFQITIFDSLIHRSFASVLEPVPDYNAPSTPRDSIASFNSGGSTGAGGYGSGDDRSIRSGREGRRRESKDKDVSRSKGLKSFFRRAKQAATASRDESQTRRLSGASDVDGAGGDGDFPLPLSLRPSMAHTDIPAGIVSSPCPKGELPTASWLKFSSIPGLGESELDVSSDLSVVGSGLLMHLDLSSLDARTTIHQIKLILTQTTRAGTLSANPGQEDITEYTLFHAGPAYLGMVPLHPTPSDYVWRGEIPRTIDAQVAIEAEQKRRRGSAISGTSTPFNAAPRPLVRPPYADAVSETSLSLSPLCRLPTPIVGAHATSPTILDPRLSRTSHALRFEVFFSVLGEASPGMALPLQPNGRIPEGNLRRWWIDHNLALGSCMITPENVIVPSYSPCLRVEEQQTHEDYLASIAARSEPASFAIPHTRRIWPEGQTLKERTAVHLEDTLGACACVFGQEVVRDMVGKRADRTWVGRGSEENGHCGNGSGSGGGGKAEQLESVTTVQRAGDL